MQLADLWKHGTRVCVDAVFFLVFQAAQHVGVQEHLYLGLGLLGDLRGPSLSCCVES